MARAESTAADGVQQIHLARRAAWRQDGSGLVQRAPWLSRGGCDCTCIIAALESPDFRLSLALSPVTHPPHPPACAGRP